MADVKVQTNLISDNVAQMDDMNKESACKRCTEMETQLKETVTELSSAQLIIEIQGVSNMTGTNCV
jgi:environmental stress-induced protein Ves